MVGHWPRIWTVKEGQEVMLSWETTDSKRTEVLVQLTAAITAH